MKITPEIITSLRKNQIFVFGSNEAGRHGKGAAKTAMSFGAIYGNPVGIQGQTYAIPTVDKYIKNKVSLDIISGHVRDLRKFILSNPDLEFLITPIGCGLAGFLPTEIAPMFHDFLELDNVCLPKSFINILKNS